MRKILTLLGFLIHFYTYGQLQENFADGNFTHNPAWLGDISFFTVNASQQLQTNGPAITATELQLAAPCRAVTGTTWEFWVRLNLATSAGNYADIYLMSDSVNLKGRNRGYFVRIGGTPDEVSLFRKDSEANPTYVINGRDGTIGATINNLMRVRVTRDVSSRWTLYLDATGTGQNFSTEGSAVDATHQKSNFLGIVTRYSSANNRNFLFDDFSVVDNMAPLLQSVQVLNTNTLALQFNEPVNPASGLSVANYSLNGVGVPQIAVADPNNPALVHLTFSQSIPAGNQRLTVTGAEDLFGNRLTEPITLSFVNTPPVVVNYREVRINEIMADFNPVVGLPPAEFIELYNPSQKTINLQGWQYSDATNIRANLPAYTMKPGSYVILCRATDTAAFRPYGPVLGLTAFPTLNDAADDLYLFDNTGKLIDRISYTATWYQHTQKAGGGWTLELINPLTSCREATNWVASRDASGGTPGRQNSVYDITPDTQPPIVTKAEVLNPNTIKLTFSEGLDSSSVRNLAAYKLTGGLDVRVVSVMRPAWQEVVLTLTGNLVPGQVYELTVQQIRDCAGNRLDPIARLAVVLPEPATVGNIIINEVLFNPRSGGVDFVEIVNRSGKYINLQGWGLSSIRPDSAVELAVITAESLIMAPQQYLVLTTRPDIVQAHYPAANQAAFLKMNRFPAYSDDAGIVRLTDAQNQEMDRFAYQASLHFKLLDDVNGVSLERIRLQGDSSATNWHSAASTVGYATPGYKNSQYFEQTPSSNFFTIEPKIFTPDDDGDKDFTTISYQSAANGYVTNITIYDASGREIKRLVKNELLARNGLFQWDGLDDRGRKAPVGYYVLYIELFNLQGQVKAYKETVVVGAKF